MRIWVSVARAIVRLNLWACLSCAFLSASLSQAALSQAAEASLHELSSVWKDQNGNPFRWKDAEGKVVLLSMVYTSCQQTCPLIISEIAALQKALPSELQDKLLVLLFSMDPGRDTPERLAAYAKERGINSRWRMLVGANDDVQELAAVLGFRYKKMANGDFAHSNVFTVLDQKGRMRHQQLELFKDRAQTVQVMAKLLQARTGKD